MPTEPPQPTAPLDRDGFARLYTEGLPRLRLIAVGMIGDRAAAEDIVHDAAATALTKMNEFTPGTNFTAWLGRFVRHAALNQRRRLAYRATVSLDAEGAPTPPDPTPPHTTGPTPLGRNGQLAEDRGEFDDRLRRELALLAPVARACLLLRTVGGLDYQAIAETLEIPRGTAMSHVSRARNLLRERLADTHTAGGVT
ncbi:MAG: RNA polymerase sigma factor [Planctomycetota bacterium]